MCNRAADIAKAINVLDDSHDFLRATQWTRLWAWDFRKTENWFRGLKWDIFSFITYIIMNNHNRKTEIRQWVNAIEKAWKPSFL